MIEHQPHSVYGLENHGLVNPGAVYWNLATPALYEQAIRRREGRLAHLGALVVRTGQHTERSPHDKYIVAESSTSGKIAWGKSNQPMTEEVFWHLHRRMMAHLEGRDLFVQDCYLGADKEYRLPVRIVTEHAWTSLFARNIFIQADTMQELIEHLPQFTVLQAPGFFANPGSDGTRSEVFVAINFAERLILIGGTQYAGEIKKSLFSALSHLLPMRNVLPMHCSANFGRQGDVALFFGRSGTGKTTLATDPQRTLIGDDEHGWSNAGIFSLESGCYAKTIRLSPTAESDIFEATRRFGTVLENVGYDPIRNRIDLDDDSLTENTRAAYPISHIPQATRTGVAGHPNNIVFLVADAYGVLPPLALLTPEQAIYHFLSGYTTRVIASKGGVTEPKATFSACFGESFMVGPTVLYAEMLGQRISQHGVKVWLVNTGWSGGPCGVGSRIKIVATRAMIHAALNGDLDETPLRFDQNFNLYAPTACPDIANEILDPRETWTDKAAYDAQARKVAAMYSANFKQYASLMPNEIIEAGPHAP